MHLYMYSVKDLSLPRSEDRSRSRSKKIGIPNTTRTNMQTPIYRGRPSNLLKKSCLHACVVHRKGLYFFSLIFFACMCGAKHKIILPDFDLGQKKNALINSMHNKHVAMAFDIFFLCFLSS
jgi:hypothetical protein